MTGQHHKLRGDRREGHQLLAAAEDVAVGGGRHDTGRVGVEQGDGDDDLPRRHPRQMDRPLVFVAAQSDRVEALDVGAKGGITQARGAAEQLARHAQRAQIRSGGFAFKGAAECGIKQALLTEQGDVVDDDRGGVLELRRSEDRQTLIAEPSHLVVQLAVNVVKEGKAEVHRCRSRWGGPP